MKHNLKTELKNMVCRKEILRKYYGDCDNRYEFKNYTKF